MRFTEDGRTLRSFTREKVVSYDIASRQAVRSFSFAPTVELIAVAGDGRHVLVARDQEPLQLLDIDARAATCLPEAMLKRVRDEQGQWETLGASLSSDASRLLRFPYSEASVTVFDVSQRTPVASRSAEHFALSGELEVSLTDDGGGLRWAASRVGVWWESLGSGRLSPEYHHESKWVGADLVLEPGSDAYGEPAQARDRINIRSGWTGRSLGRLDRKFTLEEAFQSARGLAPCGSSAVIVATARGITLHRLPSGRTVGHWPAPRTWQSESLEGFAPVCSPRARAFAVSHLGTTVFDLPDIE